MHDTQTNASNKTQKLKNLYYISYNIYIIIQF
jgi:hypothetical protein